MMLLDVVLGGLLGLLLLARPIYRGVCEYRQAERRRVDSYQQIDRREESAKPDQPPRADAGEVA